MLEPSLSGGVGRLRPVILAIASLLLLAYSGYRAWALSFTHDESLSYDLIQGNLFWLTIANNHPVNTFLMRLSDNWLGPAEWALRLPNVCAHVLYLCVGFLLSIRVRHGFAAVAGLAALNLNPFLVDFFSLARGYGLALGLSMAALGCLYAAWCCSGLATRTAWLFGASLCAALADFSNYSWLNFHVSLFGASLVVLFAGSGAEPRRPSRLTFEAAALLAATNTAVMAELVPRILSLSRGELYTRSGPPSRSGFVKDTVGSLVDSYLYRVEYPEGLRGVLVVLVVAAFFLALGVSLLHVWRDRRLSFSSVLMVHVVLSVAAPLVEHRLLRVSYPNERIALYLVPPAALLGMFLIDDSLKKTGRRARLAVVLCGAAFLAAGGAHFARSANVTHTATWLYDARTKETMQEIVRYYSGRKVHGQVRIAGTWLLQPAMDYYRRSRNYHWMAPIRREPSMRPGFDMIYIQPWQTEGLLAAYRPLKEFPEQRNLLLVARSEDGEPRP